MNLREKTALFILAELNSKAVKGLRKEDVRDEYPYILKELTSDGYLDAKYSLDESGEKKLVGHEVTERGKMRFRMLLEKWEEEQ